MTNVDFGTYSPISNAAQNTTATMTLTCTFGVLSPLYANACVSLGPGSTSTSTATRTMGAGANRLGYQLGTTASFASTWGTGSQAITTRVGRPLLGGTANTTVSIQAQILAAQPTVPVGGNANTAYREEHTAANATFVYGFSNATTATCSSLTSSGTFTFSALATVAKNCTISADPLVFPAGSVLTTARTANTNIRVTCTNQNAYQISLNGSSSGTVGARRMQRTGGSEAINYQLYQDAAYSQAWGDGTSGTTQASGTGTGVQSALTVYGRVPTQNTPSPGTYTDTITATVTF
jgi:spore coat protein U-like protein